MICWPWVHGKCHKICNGWYLVRNGDADFLHSRFIDSTYIRIKNVVGL